eukprot:gene15769-33285_t
MYGWTSYQKRDAKSAGQFRRAMDDRNILSIYPDGFLPIIAPTVDDFSATGGLTWDLGNWAMDASLGYGKNKMQFQIENSLNRSIGPSSKREFDSGGFSYNQTVFNLTGVRPLSVDGLSSPLNVALGVEARREGYELAVSKPRVVFKDIKGEKHEPIELVTADIEEGHQGGVMQALGERKGELVNMEPDGRGRVRLEYRIPARGLIGFTNEFLNLTRGSGLISNIFDSYEPHKGDIGGRKNGVLISMDAGEIFTYALGKLDDRGRMFVKPNDPVYEGMIVGIHSRDNDLVVNATRTKQLTNFRVSGKEDAIKITPPVDLNLEYGVEFIEDDELVEITPKSIRLRKRYLTENERKRAGRS